MAVIFQDYIDYLKDSDVRIVKVKVQFLRYKDESVRDTITSDVINGSGSINGQNKNGVRRSASFSLTNLDKKYLPNPDTFEIRQKIKIFLGLEINGEDYFIEQGVFIAQNPRAISSPSAGTMNISAIDKFCLADGTMGGETDGIYIIPVGTSVSDAVRAILNPSTDADREIFYDPIEPLIDTDFDAELTPYTIELANGEPVGNAILELAGMVSANVYYDGNGRLRFEKDVNDKIKASQFDFEAGDFNYSGNSRVYKYDEVYNSVLVIGANINGDIKSAVAENVNLLSETSIPNLGFKRQLPISDPNISTDQLAEDRAIYELKRVTNIQSENSVTSVPMYHLNVDEVITITDSQLDLDRERNVINSISIPISTSGTMSINCAKSIDLTLSE